MYKTDYETPFSEVLTDREFTTVPATNNLNQFSFEASFNPFQKTFQSESVASKSPYSEEYTNFLAELNEEEFQEAIYELAYEMEDSWKSKVSDEITMGNQFEPYAMKQARAYYTPMLNESDRLFEQIANHFSGNNLADQSEMEVEMFFETLEMNNEGLSPIQEQFLGGVFKKVKSFVKKGIDFAKKGINAIGKLLPINFLLKKLKGLVMPILEKVLKALLGKIPPALRPYAQSLAKKFLNLEQSEEANEEMSHFEAIQYEFDHHVAQLLFTSDENEAEGQMMEYENSFENLERQGDYENMANGEQSIELAKDRLINELKNLKADESPSPAIERFLPVAIMALRPVIKMAISLIGRDKIISFLGDLLSGLIKNYVPQEVSKPLASSIIDIGMSAIGFEVHEMNSSNIAYEALANTIDETITGMNTLNTNLLGDTHEMTLHLLESFEKAAANNFPPNYIKPNLRLTKQRATWVSMPRNSPIKVYKKFTHIYSVQIDQKLAGSIKIFRNVPLLNFLKDKYGLNISESGIKARVHVYELGRNGRLSMISRFENLPGMNHRIRRAWIQLLPLTKEVSALLLNEPNMGTVFSQKSLSSRYKVKGGQRFYYLEIEGARLKYPQTLRKGLRAKNVGLNQVESRSADVQAILNFSKSEIKIQYYFSEEDSKNMVEKMKNNDTMGVLASLKSSVKTVFDDIVKNNISSKVKIIHESMPQVYLESFTDLHENLLDIKDLGNKMANATISKLVEKLSEVLSAKAYESLVNFFKTRSKEFETAQSQPQDGVTITISWKNIQGMAMIKNAISAIKGNGTLPKLSDLTMPVFPNPELKIEAGKTFE